jgi:hypothetical protein
MYDASSVVGNSATDKGGGVFCWGRFRMHDSSSLVGNRAATDGGGAFVLGADFELGDSATVRDNRAGWSGAGIHHDAYSDDDYDPSAVTLSGSSSITGNRAGRASSCCSQGCRGPRSWAGGLWVSAASMLTMTGSSLISGNHATCGGGGLYSEVDADLGGALSGVSCAPETPANVSGNTPDDCHFE